MPGNVLEAGLLALALSRLRQLRTVTSDPVLRFGALVLAVLLPATVGGLMCAGLLALEDIGPLPQVWLTWTLGGLLGALACVPVGLLVHERGLSALRTLAQPRSLVAIVLMTALVFASFQLFTFPFASAGAAVLLVAAVARSAGLAAVLPFLVVALAALGFGREGMAISTLNLLPGHTASFLASCAITLLQHPQVADIALRLHDFSGTPRLKAFVVPAPGAQLGAQGGGNDAHTGHRAADDAALCQRLHAWAARHLAPVARPSDIRIGPRLPVNAMGKACDWPLAAAGSAADGAAEGEADGAVWSAAQAATTDTP